MPTTLITVLDEPHRSLLEDKKLPHFNPDYSWARCIGALNTANEAMIQSSSSQPVIKFAISSLVERGGDLCFIEAGTKEFDTIRFYDQEKQVYHKYADLKNTQLTGIDLNFLASNIQGVLTVNSDFEVIDVTFSQVVPTTIVV